MQFQKWFPHHPSKSKENDFPATVFKCTSFVRGVKIMRIPWIQSWAHPGWWITASTSHLPSMQPKLSQGPLCSPPPPICSRPLSPWPWRHSPLTGMGIPARGDFTVPITLTTAQIKRCHLNHKQQSKEAGELSVTEKEREAESERGREAECKGVLLLQTIKTQSPMYGLRKFGETVAAQLEGGVRSLKELGLSPVLPLTGHATLEKLLALSYL